MKATPSEIKSNLIPLMLYEESLSRYKSRIRTQCYQPVNLSEFSYSLILQKTWNTIQIRSHQLIAGAPIKNIYNIYRV